jgi:hypothetical protein
MNNDRPRKSLFAFAASLALLAASHGLAQQPKAPDTGTAAAAGDIANFFRQVGDQIYEYCIFELSQDSSQ